MKLSLRTIVLLAVFGMLMTVTAASALPQGHPATDSQRGMQERHQQPIIVKMAPLEIRNINDDYRNGDRGRNHDKQKVKMIAKCTVLGDARDVKIVLKVGGQNIAFQKISGNQYKAVYNGDLNKRGVNKITEKATVRGRVLPGSAEVKVINLRGFWHQNSSPLRLF